MDDKMTEKKPKMAPKDALIYACSGCSSSAQMANALAVQMDRDGIAKMSCIAGVGGGVKPLVNKAKTAQAIISLDGCSLHCVEHCLKQHGLKSTVHYDLSKMGVSKKYHRDFDSAQKEELYQALVKDITGNPLLPEAKRGQ